jgi:hypothetical protein
VIPRSTDPRVIVRALEMVLLGVHYIPADALSLDAPVPSGSCARSNWLPRSRSGLASRAAYRRGKNRSCAACTWEARIK